MQLSRIYSLSHGDPSQDGDDEHDEEHGVFLLVTLLVLILISIVAYIHSKLEKYLSMLPLASMCILFGVVLGYILSATGELDAAFSFEHEFFFSVLLPPCIFAAGFELDKEVFFHNLGSITLLAFLGTFLSSMLIGSSFYGLCFAFGMDLNFFECLVFGSLISAVDPVATMCVLSNVGVDKHLYMLIFGESVLNDAVSIILFRTFNKLAEQDQVNITSEFFSGLGQIILSAIISFLLGTSFGLLTSVIFKYMDFHEKTNASTVHIMVSVEISFFIFTCMTPYYLAEHLGYSGIMALLFNAIWSDKYGVNHLSHHAFEFIEGLIRFLQFLAEHFLFTYLGMAIFTVDHVDFRADIAFISIALCLAARCVSVFPLCMILNSSCGRKNKIPMPWQVLMWWAGLRGPVAFALALMVEKNRGFIESTTLVIVLFTTILMGGSTTALVGKLGLQEGTVRASLDESHTFNDSVTLLTGDGYWDSNHWFITLDRKYLTPWFGAKKRHKDSHSGMPGPLAENARQDLLPQTLYEGGGIGNKYSLHDISLDTSATWANIHTEEDVKIEKRFPSYDRRYEDTGSIKSYE